jgi:vacuolar-type H+-ATPase subunit I/STV1
MENNSNSNNKEQEERLAQREARLKALTGEEHRKFPAEEPGTGEEILDEEEALRRAMELSLAESGGHQSTETTAPKHVEAATKKPANTQVDQDRAAAEAEMSKLEAAGNDQPPEIHHSVEGQTWEEEMVPVPVDEGLLTQLIDMGFSDVRGRKAIVHGKTLEGALEWIGQHEQDPDIDQPYMVKKSDTIPKAPLTAEERAKKIQEMQERIKKRREEREKQEKAEAIRQEKARRERGQKMEETMEERDKMLRKLELERQKREKLEVQKERERLKAEIARDKEIRKLNRGVLPSTLGVEGYNPPVAQYDVPLEHSSSAPSSSVPAKRSSEEATAKPVAVAASKPQSSSTSGGAVKTARKDEPTAVSTQTPDERIDSAIATISRFRTSGDGGQALKLLITFVKNIVENPDEPK